MDEKKPIKIKFNTGVIIGVVMVIIFFIAIAGFLINIKNSDDVIGGGEPPIFKAEKKDDWEYDASKANPDGISKGMNSNLRTFSSGATAPQSAVPSTATDGVSSAESFADTSSSNIGFSTGGAKDVNNFRENIENGYFPISTDITYNGLFYDYTFDTGRSQESTELFSPSYSTAISKDPISEKNETYMTVGLNSNIKQSDFKRKKLNLTVVLDISGSMSSSFSSYYYDQFTGKRKDKTSEDDNKSKMQIANESVNVLLDQLKDDDRFGMVLFDDSAYIGKPISLVGNTDITAIKNHILEIGAMGGTNFEAGYTKATELYKEYQNINSDEYENRIIVITDAMPNYGSTSKEGLLSYVKENADKGIYTSFVGVGVDFNTELIEAISDVKGANYYSVHNSSEFKSRMGEEFEYMVTPLVFDLQLNLKSDDFEIAKVYGSDTVNKENGNIMHVNTLFPSKTTSTGEVKGGIVLLKLNKKGNNDTGTVNLSVSYKDRNGQDHSNSQAVKLEDKNEHYDNTGIRKAIVLTRYANTIKKWIMHERTGEKRFIIVPQYGIMDCDYTREEVYRMLGENERTSVSLKVSSEYKDVFEKLKIYMNSEIEQIKDESMKQEIKILDKLIK